LGLLPVPLGYVGNVVSLCVIVLAVIDLTIARNKTQHAAVVEMSL